MQNILVIGGGFAGLSAALNGADQVRQHGGEIAVTVVSNSKSITMRPRLYEVNPQTLREPLRPIFDAAGIPFKCAEARAIDPVARTVELNAPNGEPETLSYDRLILTAGSRLKSPRCRALPKILGISIATTAPLLSMSTCSALPMAARRPVPVLS